jgi:hypothetical protein
MHNKPTVNFRRESESTTHELFAECRRALLTASKGEAGMIAQAHSVDALIGTVKPNNWRDAVQQAQQYCTLNIIEVNKPTPAKGQVIKSPVPTTPKK